ncbi:MAG: hypothetical protein WAN51_04995 [Alphaproteobacteria bacterium]
MKSRPDGLVRRNRDQVAVLAEATEVVRDKAADPVLVAEWELNKLVNRWRKIDETANPGEWQAADQAWRDAEMRMVDTPAASLAGVIAKLVLAAELLADPA